MTTYSLACWNLACKFPECCSFALEKRKEVGGLLKPFENWAQGGMNSYHWAQGIIDFLHNGSQVLHLTPWVVGGWKCIPRCSFNLKYLHSQPFHSGEGWEAWGAGVPTFLLVVWTCWWRHLLLTYFSSHSENWASGFWFSVARCQQHLFSGLDHKVREEHRASPPWNTY